MWAAFLFLCEILAIDHDRLFKSLLRTFFIEFLELFCPELAHDLDRGRLEFLDKEIFTDLNSGVRHEVDLLVNKSSLSRSASVLFSSRRKPVEF